MLLTLNNQYLKVQINTKGAELNSVQNEGVEYLWQSNSKYWSRHAPILFPIVGRLKGNHYQYDQKDYYMTQHGFARDLEFNVVKHNNRMAALELTDNSQTRKIYPFHFKLTVIYHLNLHDISVDLIVENTDSKQIWFSIGAHPGFNIPIQHNQSKFENYAIKVVPNKVYKRIKLHNSYSDAEHAVDDNLNQPVPLTHALFKHDARILELNRHETTVMLSNDIDDNGIALHVKDCPYLGIWSTKDAPFVCIEPWWGIADDIKHDGNLKTKCGINQLMPQHKFNANFNITFF